MNNENENQTAVIKEEKEPLAVVVTPQQSSEEELDTEIEQLREDLAGEVVEEELVAEPAGVKPRGPEYYLTDYIIESYRNASPYLKQILRGTVELSVRGQIQKVYSYNFEDEATYSVGQKTSESVVAADYLVLENLMRGRINAQIALLSKQIKVSGNVMKGMYFLNLLRNQRV